MRPDKWPGCMGEAVCDWRPRVRKLWRDRVEKLRQRARKLARKQRRFERSCK